ncbi:unnamed protein product [Arctogadus glacialis]
MGGGCSDPLTLGTVGGREVATTHNPQRPSACCFCWCCCCSCSWNEEERREEEEEEISGNKDWTPLPSCEDCCSRLRRSPSLGPLLRQSLMRNPAGRNVFREFLRTEYSEGEHDVWLACEDLKEEGNRMQGGGEGSLHLRRLRSPSSLPKRSPWGHHGVTQRSPGEVEDEI